MKTPNIRHCSPAIGMMILLLCLALSFSGVVAGAPAVQAAGTYNWTQLPLCGGNVLSLAVDPKTPAILYAGTQDGVYRSANSGATWAATTAATSPRDVLALAIGPEAPTTLYAGTLEEGVFRSRDSGATWTLVNAGLGTAVVGALVIDRVTPTTLYACSNRGVFRSTDSGDHWIEADTGITAGPSAGTGASIQRVTSLVIDPLTPSTLYAGSYYGVFRSSDSGNHWTEVDTGIAGVSEDDGTLHRNVTSLAADPAMPMVLYAATNGGGVFCSTDKGDHWTPMNTGLSDLHAGSLVISSVAPATLTVAADSGIFRLVRGGATWTMANAGITNHTLALAVDPQTPGVVYAGTDGAGVFRSADAGDHWAAVNTGLPFVNVSSLAVDPASKGTIYAGTDSGVFRSRDSGATWTAANAGITEWGVNCLVIDPHTPATLYVGTHNGVYRSDDAGDHWTAANTGITKTRIAVLAINPHTPTTLYAGTNLGVFRSTDSGATWTAIDAGLPVHTDVWSLAIDSANPAALYVSIWTMVATSSDIFHYPDSVFRSTDAGDHWNAVNVGVTNEDVESFAIDPVVPANLYAGTMHGSVCRSTDGGAAWTVEGIVPSYGEVQVLVVDPHANGTVYAGTSVGVFRSVDAGVTWSAMSTGLSSKYVTELAADRLTAGVLYAATDDGILRYQAVSSPKSVIQLKIGSTTMHVDGKAVPLEAAPIIINSRTLVPLRALIETLGGKVVWSPSARTVDMFLGGRSVDVGVGGNIGYVNDKGVAIDPANPKVVPLIINNRAFLPLRFVAEALDLDVHWYPATKTITITYTP
ncbi:MAG TPA: stalk domain-containing protein [Candidatus Deferrimicrobium sp.]|nr:stalk domain-containing protein [Candidatus Deferrimicrobium sp.]